MASEQKENTCVVCFKEVEIFSIGQCDHPVCFECSTRMRVLCRQNECPMCRQEMPMVIFTRRIQPFELIKNGNFLMDNKYKISFFTADEKAAYDTLLSHDCPECGKVSPNFGHLKEHVRRVHLLTYCELCVDNLKILTKERRCYNRKDLATHRRVGDADDRSHTGHPLCEFCDKRYMDTDELYRHLRREHLFCHFCDADGRSTCFYKSYNALREHYRNDHFLCEEGDCYMEEFTSVFRTEIDLKAHKAATHGKGLSKAGLKQARTLDIAFTLAPRPRPQRNNRYQGQSGVGMREEDPEGAVGGAVEEPPPPPVEAPPQPVASRPNAFCIDDFPSLGGGAPPPPPPTTSGGKQHKVKTASASVCSRKQFSMDDFPALGGEVQPPPAVSTSVTMRVNTEMPTSSSDAPQMNLSIQLSSPQFMNKPRNPKKTYYMNFPALDEGSTDPPVASTTASVQWTTQTKQSKESQTPQSTAASQLSKSKPLPQMDDFPALAPKPANPLFPVRPPKTSTASNTMEELFTTSKSKKKSKSKSKTNTGSTNDTSSMLKKKQEDSGYKREDFLKKKPAESGAGEPSVAVTNYKTAAQERRERLYDGMVETERTTIRQADPNIKMVTAEQVMMMKGGSGKENKHQANKPVKVDDSAFPALPGLGPPSSFEAKWEAKKTVKPKPVPPGLVKSPPSGIVKSPPPGLEGPSDANSVPDFNVNGSFPPLHTGMTYVLPPHFERRNATLVDKIAKALGTDALNDFKQISFSFRNAVLAPAEYYQYCKEMMGNDSFVSIFPELLALLPDINKQQEIWPHYKTDKERFEASTTKGNRLDACATCGQVLRSGDLKDHLTRHNLDNHFPTLDTKPKTGKNAWSHK